MKKLAGSNQFKAVDFFCGAGGMTNGFIKVGINVIAGIDIDISCKKTYEENNKGAKFIHADIKNLTFNEFDEQTSVEKKDDHLIFIGCSPCQYWTKITTTRDKSAESKNLLNDFQRFVEHYMPGYIVIENVPGIVNTKQETPLTDFLTFLTEHNYVYDKGVIKVSQYGVPQTRKRFLLIATRVKESISLPMPDKKYLPTVRQFISREQGFRPIKAGTKDDSDFLHTTADLSDLNLERLRLTPKNGGTRIVYVNDKRLAVKSQLGKKNSFSDTYGRMHWDKPAPTITTKFYSISNGRFAHPEQNRAISLREGATLQTFEKSYIFFEKTIGTAARHIGNAVPPELAKMNSINHNKTREVNNG